MALRACKECGHQISSSAKTCPQCGKKQRTTTGFELFLIVGSLVVLISYYGFEGNKDAPHHLVQPGPAGEVATTPSPVPAPQPRHAIGEDFSVGYWSYRCNRAIWQPFIVSGFETLERPDAAFLIVDLVATNNDRTSSTLPPFKLVDAQGREYDESSKGSLLNGAFDLLKQLNPGVSSRGFVVFDAPHPANTR